MIKSMKKFNTLKMLRTIVTICIMLFCVSFCVQETRADELYYKTTSTKTKKSKQKQKANKTASKTTTKTTWSGLKTDYLNASYRDTQVRYNYKYKVKTVVKTTTSYKKNSKTVTTKTVTTKYYYTTLNNLTPNLPDKMRRMIDKKGFSLVFTENRKPTGGVSGVTDFRKRQIRMSNVNQAIYHEVGHVLACEYVKDSSTGRYELNYTTTEFKNIFASEKGLVKTYNRSYVTQNANEYFAESVKDYCLRGSWLKKERPKTYNYIVNCINRLNY